MTTDTTPTAAVQVVDVKAEIKALIVRNDEYRKQIKENKARIASLKILAPKGQKGKKRLTDEEKAARAAAKEAAKAEKKAARETKIAAKIAAKAEKKAAREAKKVAKIAAKAAKALASGGKKGRPKMTDEQKAAAKAAREAAKAVATAVEISAPVAETVPTSIVNIGETITE